MGHRFFCNGVVYMGIYLISISHRAAPLEIRELFAFSEEMQVKLMQKLIACGIAQECVMISTCNRTEIYSYTENLSGHFTKMQDLLLAFANAEQVDQFVAALVRLQKSMEKLSAAADAAAREGKE